MQLKCDDFTDKLFTKTLRELTVETRKRILKSDPEAKFENPIYERTKTKIKRKNSSDSSLNDIYSTKNKKFDNEDRSQIEKDLSIIEKLNSHDETTTSNSDKLSSTRTLDISSSSSSSSVFEAKNISESNTKKKKIEKINVNRSLSTTKTKASTENSNISTANLNIPAYSINQAPSSSLNYQHFSSYPSYENQYYNNNFNTGYYNHSFYYPYNNNQYSNFN